jgi:predicted RNA-binding protein (virulence factor B family)
MALLGRTNRLQIGRSVDYGVYLDSENLGEILLPQRYVPDDATVGDWVEAFIYRDSKDRLIATTEVPKVEVGECAYLKVIDVNPVGAFLDWGLPKDLFVPYAEQLDKMKAGEHHVVYAYIDNTDRLAASARLAKFLSTTTRDYQVGDKVQLLVSRQTDLGWEVVVDDAVLGLVFKNDALDRLEPGTQIEGYVKAVRGDGKITLSLQPPLATDEDLGERIMRHLRESGGKSTLTDKSSPDEIFAHYGVSKRAYKRAIGGLYRQRRIVIGDDVIELVD